MKESDTRLHKIAPRLKVVIELLLDCRHKALSAKSNMNTTGINYLYLTDYEYYRKSKTVCTRQGN